MGKPELAPVSVASRELLPLKSVWLTVDSRDHRSKTVFLDLPDEYSPQDISDNPKLFRTIQADRNKALNSGDKVELWWFDKVAFATVDYADNSEVVLLKMDIRQRRQRDRTPWTSSCGQYDVRPIFGKWSWFRKSDNVQMGGLRDNWEAARADCWQHTGARV